MASPSRPVVATISDPQKIGEGLQAYVSYKISATVRARGGARVGDHGVRAGAEYGHVVRWLRSPSPPGVRT